MEDRSMKEGWEYKKLNELCEVITKGTTPTTLGYTFSEVGINFIKIESISTNKKLLRDKLNYISEECNNSMSRSQLQESDLLFSIAGALGRIYIVEQSVLPANTNQALAIIRLKNKQDLFLQYLSYYLSSNTLKRQIDKDKVGVAQLNLSLSQIKNFIIPIPSINNQQHIVEELDLLSSIIEKKKAQLNELDNLAQSLFYEMFGESSNWECKQLKEITTKMGSGATPRGGNQSYKEDGVSLIRSLNVHNGHFKYDDLAHIDEQQASQLDNVTIKENDVLLNITGASVARCCIVPTDILPARVNQHVSILRVKETLLNSTYLCHCLISPNSQAELLIMSKSNAATREALPKATLEKYLVPIPPLDLQNQFAEKVQAIEHQKELIKQSIKEVETLFNSRMDYYFN